MKIAKDKKLHLIIGFFIALLLNIYIVVLIGAGKEVYDKVSKKGTPELLDFIYTVAGGILAYLILYLVGVKLEFNPMYLNILGVINVF